ncbi:MAG TPA: SpoVR family protein [Hyphomicrobiaceae bacterium]|jgi:spore cortex formation protein SpoVR/YcgB (stage V sporulation)
MTTVLTRKPLFEGAEWNFELLKKAYDAIEEIGVGEMGLNIYTNQIEVITAEQMLDAYASIGMPNMYRHWSFGKHFAREEVLYRKGARALAYELVINSDPCINYVMEENTMTMQLLVMAHAAMGHNHFFKNNYLFQQWTDATAILDYLRFAKEYVAECEEKYGLENVEAVLDSAHALMAQGISRHPVRRQSRTDKQERELRRREHEEATYNELWRTVPRSQLDEKPATPEAKEAEAESNALGLPQENLLYFLEKHAPKLDDWKRELLRIVRMLAQYFYPQRQTKVMNEGCATFVHYEIMSRLYDKGLITEGSMLEFMHSHSSVVYQPRFEDKHFNGFNPYALGFAMMRDIKRIAEEPTPEDREWFPEIAGNGDALGTLKEAWANFRDDSFIMQYLSPKLIRDFRLFHIHDNTGSSFVEVKSIHDEMGYRRVRKVLAEQYDTAARDPDIQVVNADLSGGRRLTLQHRVRRGVLLDKDQCDRTLQHVAHLWGYRVKMLEVDAETGKVLKEHEALPLP